MTTTEAQSLIVRLRERVPVEPGDIASWLMDSKSRLAFDKYFSVHDAEQYVYTSDICEHYDDAHRNMALAIGYCWSADKHSALILIERLMVLLEYNYSSNELSYNQLITKLNLLRAILN